MAKKKSFNPIREAHEASDEELEKRVTKSLDEFSKFVDEDNQKSLIEDHTRAHVRAYSSFTREVDGFKVPGRGDEIKDDELVDKILAAYLLRIVDELHPNLNIYNAFKKRKFKDKDERLEFILRHANLHLGIETQHLAQIRNLIKRNNNEYGQVFSSIENHLKDPKKLLEHYQRKYWSTNIDKPEHYRVAGNPIAKWLEGHENFRYRVKDKDRFRAEVTPRYEETAPLVKSMVNDESLDPASLKDLGLTKAKYNAPAQRSYGAHGTGAHGGNAHGHH